MSILFSELYLIDVYSQLCLSTYFLIKVTDIVHTVPYNPESITRSYIVSKMISPRVVSLFDCSTIHDVREVP